METEIEFIKTDDREVLAIWEDSIHVAAVLYRSIGFGWIMKEQQDYLGSKQLIKIAEKLEELNKITSP